MNLTSFLEKRLSGSDRSDLKPYDVALLCFLLAIREKKGNEFKLDTEEMLGAIGANRTQTYFAALRKFQDLNILSLDIAPKRGVTVYFDIAITQQFKTA